MKRILIIAGFVAFLFGIIFAISHPINITNISFFYSSKYLLYSILIIISMYIFSICMVPINYIMLYIIFFISGYLNTIFYINYSYKGILFINILFIIKFIIYFCIILNSFYYKKYIQNIYKLIFKRSTLRNVKLYLKKMAVILAVIFVLILIDNIFVSISVSKLSKYLLF